MLPAALWVFLDTVLEAESTVWVGKAGDALEKIGLPFWLPALIFVGFPFLLPLVALGRRCWRLAAVQWVALFGVTALEVAVAWWLASQGLLIRVHTVHPFPGSLSAAAAAGVEVAEPLDPNDWGLRGLPLPPVPEEGRPSPVGIELWKASQPGMFWARIWSNPGEPGDLFLRVSEYSTGAPVSESAPPGNLEHRNISHASRHPARFSTESGTVLCTEAPRFTVFEGDRESFFAGRIELWFAPKTGGEPRKLADRLFRLNGWGR